MAEGRGPRAELAFGVLGGSDLFAFGPSVAAEQRWRLFGMQPEAPDVAFRDELVPRERGAVVLGAVEEVPAEVGEDEPAPGPDRVRKASVLRTPSSVRY